MRSLTRKDVDIENKTEQRFVRIEVKLTLNESHGFERICVVVLRGNFGGGAWSRTTDAGLMRPLLCQLSYTAELKKRRAKPKVTDYNEILYESI